MVASRIDPKPARRSRKVLKIAQLCLGAILIVLLFSQEDRGWQAIELALGSSLPTLLVLVALSLAMNWVSAMKWHLLSRARGLEVSLTRLTVLYLIGKFFSNFVPGMIGGDVSRSYLFGRYIGSQSTAAASIFLERFTGLLVLVLLAAGATLLRPTVLGSPAIGLAVAIGSASGGWASSCCSACSRVSVID